MNLFYSIYNYIKKTKNLLSKIIVLKYLVIIVITANDLIHPAISNLYIFVIIDIFSKFVKKYIHNDNRLGQEKHLIAIRFNNYINQKIDDSEINHYST